MDRNERIRRRQGSGSRTGGAGDRARTPAGAAGGGKGWKGEIWEWGKTIALTLVLLVFIRTFLVQTFVITSGSMEDTLLVGDFLMVNRISLGTRLPGTQILTPSFSEPQLGDVLVFDPAHEDTMKLVKRLVGMEGDTLEMRAKALYRNGIRLEEPYVKWGDPAGDHTDPRMSWQLAHLPQGTDPTTYRPTRDSWGPLVVPEGYYFMLGDNRDFSLDSRYWGLIERWRIEGRALFFYFSYNRDSVEPFPALREIRWDRIGRAIR